MDPPPVSMEVLYERYLDDVFDYILGHVSSYTEAEELTAEVFAAAARAFPRFRGECSPFTWLVAIARQKLAQANRERGQRRELSEAELTEELQETLDLLLVADLDQLPEEALLQKESREIMRQLLASLPATQREVLLLQVEQGLTIREIARVIGRSEAAANSLLERARAAIFRRGKGYYRG